MFCHASPPVGGTADTINLDGKHFHPDCRAATAAKGTVNLFVCLDVNRPWRRSKVTQRRRPDYAQCMGELVDVHYPDAACIRVVQDNLSNHSAGAPFPPAEARRILRRLEFHYTPNTPVGSTWWKSRSASCAADAWTAVSIIPTASSAKLPLGTSNAIPPVHASNGCSQPKKPAPK
ncbi:hypothetical protein ACVWZR_002301 [Bradyrhizobium sp. i1.3.1]